MPKRITMRALLHEHNTLNGFWFVLVEFILAAVVTLLVGAAELTAWNSAWAIGYFGIAANATAICATVIGQIRQGQQSNSIAETYFGAGRERTQREHPNLNRHTCVIVAVTLVPFLLAVLLLVDS